MIKVTVAIIAYYRQFLKECIESVLNQTYKDIKVIVYDDCSLEDLKSVVDSFDDERLHYFRNGKNLGTFGNTNQAIDLCDTEYINVFHGDDVMFPWMIEKLFNAMESNRHAAIATSKARVLDEKQRHVQNFRVKKLEYTSVTVYGGSEYVRELCKTGQYKLACPATFIRKKELDQAKIRFNLNVGSSADVYFFIETNSNGLNLCFLNEELLFWRRHNKTWSYLTSLQEGIDALIPVDNLVRSLNLDISLNQWHAFCVLLIIWHAWHVSCKSRSKKILTDIMAIRKRLEKENGWCISDRQFADSISILYAGDVIIQIGERRAPFSLFKEREKDLRQFHISIPWKRKLKWLIKYIIYLRVFNIFQKFL